MYKITSMNNPELVYYGHTCDTLSRRFSKHKTPSNKTISKIIIEKGDAVIILLENYPCDSEDQAYAREAYYILNNPCVNKCIPGRTDKEYGKYYRSTHKEQIKQYYEEHIDEKKEYDKIRYEFNKEQFQKKAKEYYSSNKDEINIKRKEYREENKEKIQEQKTKYREAHKEQIKEKSSLMYLKKKAQQIII